MPELFEDEPNSPGLDAGFTSNGDPALEVETTVREEQSAIQRVETGSVSPFDVDPSTFKAALARRSENMKALLDQIATELSPEKGHYGKIHVVGRDKCSLGNRCTNPNHFSKNVLFKPGAEKINQFLGLTARYRPLTEKERADYGIIEADQIVVKCELMDRGMVIAEGLGARAVDLRDGVHALNKALKMAEKSARINATIQLGLSDCYTQDLDDMVGGEVQGRSGTATPEPPSMEPELMRALDNATVNRLEAVLKYAPTSMTDEDHKKLADAKARLHLNAYEGAGEKQGEGAPSPAGEQARTPTGPQFVSGECACGSVLEKRKSAKGNSFVTCSLQYRAKYGKDASAKVKLDAVERERPELVGKHTYKMNGK